MSSIECQEPKHADDSSQTDLHHVTHFVSLAHLGSDAASAQSYRWLPSATENS